MRRASRPRLRAVPLALALAFALAAPSITLADPPSRVDERFTDIQCPLTVTDDGAFVLFAFVESGFAEVFVAYWAEPPADETVPPTLEGVTNDVILTGLDVDAVVPMTDLETGTAQGSGTVAATLTPIGEPTPISDRFKHFRLEGTEQAASVAGSLTIDADILDGPVTFDLSGCSGFIVEQQIFEVHPGTLQGMHDEIELTCVLESDNATAVVNGFSLLFEDTFQFGFTGVTVTPFDPAAGELQGGSEEGFGPTGGELAFTLVDVETEEEDGEGTLSVSFAPLSTTRGTRVAQDYIQKMLVTTMAVTGSLIVETDEATYEFTDFSSCEAFLLDFHNISHSPNGPQPGGKALANDTPDGALAVEQGTVVRMQTGAAAIDPEEPCFIEFDGELLQNFWGRTVWFSVEGTGDPITFDPSGSNFDTAIAAYTSSDGGLEHLACIDDDFGDPIQPPQAPLTIDTEDGVIYLIQVGGFDGAAQFDEPDPEFGRLRLEIR